MTSPRAANARMYAVTPEAEEAWRGLLAHVADDAGVALRYEPYPAPAPLEDLWRRPDLGCVFMCGFPIVLGVADVTPVAAPIPSLPWAEGRAVYRSDFIVRADSPFRKLEDTFGGRFGWTVRHSHSGFNAPRRHLLDFRRPDRPRLYARSTGDLVTARRILDAVVAGDIDVGPLDAYWHALIRRFRPDLTEALRVVASTALAPAPCFVAAAEAPADETQALRAAFAGAASRPWFASFAGPLQLAGFAPADVSTYAMIREADEAARHAGYDTPG